MIAPPASDRVETRAAGLSDGLGRSDTRRLPREVVVAFVDHAEEYLAVGHGQAARARLQGDAGFGEPEAATPGVRFSDLQRPASLPG